MKRAIILSLLIFISAAITGREIKGRVLSGTHGISGVAVSDGFSLSITGASGEFSINTSDQAKFVFIVTPSGYTAKRVNGVSQFFKKLEKSADYYEFMLDKFNDKNGFALLAVGDPQTKNDLHFSMYEKTVLPDLKELAAQYRSKNIPSVAVYLGDIVWDTMSLFEKHKSGMESLNMPVYTAIGNHDYVKELSGDSETASAYENSFGPAYYGFNLGNNYFIVLDNIIYDTNKKYTEDLDRQQTEWLSKYAVHIPSGADVFVVMHATINKSWINDYQFTPGYAQLLKILSGFRLSFITGHTHINSNIEFLPGITEHNVASSCGAWWNSACAPDGTPSGYQVFELQKSGNEWYYKTLGKDRDYQMQIYPAGSFKILPDAIVAKIWNWDSKWRVEWFSDGRYMGEMKQFSSSDPAYENDMELLMKEGKIKRAEFERGNYLKPRVSNFYFSAIPPENALQIKVVVTDRFGRQYINLIKLDKE